MRAIEDPLLVDRLSPTGSRSDLAISNIATVYASLDEHPFLRRDPGDGHLELHPRCSPDSRRPTESDTDFRVPSGSPERPITRTMRRQRSAEDGFTMIEIMVVVLVIGLLISIALPTFLGARERAQDRGVQTDVRNAFLAERVYYTDAATYTEDTPLLDDIEPALDYVVGDVPAAVGNEYVHVHAGPNELFVSGRSVSGTCFYIRRSTAAARSSRPRRAAAWPMSGVRLRAGSSRR